MAPGTNPRNGPPSPALTATSSASNTTSSTSNAASLTSNTTYSTSSDPPKQRRARTSKPKVKTGCNNCKQRRIKCDEKRPACTQCVRSKKDCSGYPPPPRSARPFEETPVVQQNSMTLYRPSTAPFPEQDGLYFQLFQAHTANELSGYFDSTFWSRLVLQECHSEAAVRHAVVALGALYKTLEKHCESPPSSPAAAAVVAVDSAWQHWEVAVRSYSNALTALFSVDGQDSTANRTRLMASVLLACFDSFIGDHKQAIKQIQMGLGLLEQLRAQRRRAFLSRPEEPVEDEIIQMFTRLAIQAKSYDMAFHFPKPYVIQLIQPSTDPSSPSSEGGSPLSLHQDPIPDQFDSLHEARIAWDTLCEQMFRFTERLFAQASQDGPMGVLPASLRQYGLSFRGRIEAWADAFEHILSARSSPGVSSQEKAAIAVLKMFQIMGQVLFLMTFSDSEQHFDVFQPQFKTIVDLGLEVVGDEERRAAEKRCPDPRTCHHHNSHEPDIFGGQSYMANHIKPSFSADLGIVPPLYVVATKCRNPVLRRQAIQLLRSSSRREGMWDSELTARIGMWIMDIEEEEEHPIMTPGRSPADSFSDASGLSPQASSTNGMSPKPRHANGSVELGENLGPGGNARWDMRRASTASSATPQRTVPENKRVMVKAVEFDLKKHSAVLQCGSRSTAAGSPDLKTLQDLPYCSCVLNVSWPENDSDGDGYQLPTGGSGSRVARRDEIRPGSARLRQICEL
ncbi:hypothetical protein J7T55_001991 [Diaporthe amygdali]|uniref:uncharacterized protein n=1 Tax=Phomopsis amygdali TaxID=1214568 RepID=UPI0022FDD7E2|nr:uncharacterized protein J7T55_001991 [Diaporthe amygdali]KAJ0117791.1 hypothetical protein J7T55_001991 [Diaporthe amygdali]